LKENRGVSLHAQSIIIDGLNVSRWQEETFLKLHRGGLTAINATIAVWEDLNQTIHEIVRWHQYFQQYDNIIMPIRTVADIKKAKEAGKVGIIFGFQNISPIEDDLNLLSIYKELGVRIIQPVFHYRNPVGDGCWEQTDSGLSMFGIQVIKALNHLGILIDLSHAGHQTTMEAIEVSQKPVACTHANPRALCDHPRTKTDEELKFLAQKGGVVGASSYPSFLASRGRATLADFLDVIDYLVNLLGVDHVAIGTDLVEGQPEEFFLGLRRGRIHSKPLELPVVFPEGIRSASDFPNITAGLLDRGYSESDVVKIIGGNLLRLFEEVWSVE
jgi:membrane dipeptidase